MTNGIFVVVNLGGNQIFFLFKEMLFSVVYTPSLPVSSHAVDLRTNQLLERSDKFHALVTFSSYLEDDVKDGYACLLASSGLKMGLFYRAFSDSSPNPVRLLRIATDPDFTDSHIEPYFIRLDDVPVGRRICKFNEPKLQKLEGPFNTYAEICY